MKPQLTIEAFADWCEKQPTEKTYDYADIRNCAFCQYLRSLGFEAVRVTPFDWSATSADGSVVRHLLQSAIDDAVNAGVMFSDGVHAQWTFGALAARLRASQP